MQQQGLFKRFGNDRPQAQGQSGGRKLVIGVILIVALLAFEIFNFDTTRFALDSLLGTAAFWGISWATILAIAFCAIDFAGLARLFTPERGPDEPKAVWFLMGAWLLGASMNAVMTWWAVSLTLLNHDLGNEVLGRETLLTFVPIFVAGLVLLTRVLFIGAFSVAGEEVFDLAGQSKQQSKPAARPTAQPTATRQQPAPQMAAPSNPAARPPSGNPGAGQPQRAPVPGMRRVPSPMRAKPRR